MDSFHYILQGFAVALQPGNLLYTFVGCLIGTVIGVLPGLGPSAGMALLIPAAYSMNPTSALIMMAGMYYGAMYGGSTTSILMNTPGEAASVMTTLDGYRMAVNGRAGAALAVSAIGSFIAGTIGVLLLGLLAGPFAKLALMFGPPEYFTLMVFSMTTVAALTGKSVPRGMLSMLLGLMFATVGVDLQSGVPRFAFAVPELQDGVGFLVAAVGMFAVAEVCKSLESHYRHPAEVLGVRGSLWLTRDEWRRSLGPILRGTAIGFVKGVLPGGGATISTVLSYSLERALSKEKHKFGSGMIEGVAGPEAANNAASAGAMVPLLALGIPGSGATAVLMGAFIIFGVQPGPLLMGQHPELFWGLVNSMYVGNLMLFVLNLPLIMIFVRLLTVPAGLLLPIIIAVAALGIYATNSSTFELWLMLGFGVLGYGFRSFGVPTAPLVLSLVLGGAMEQSFRQSMTISGGDPAIFVSSRIGIFFLVLSGLFLLAAVIVPRWRARTALPLQVSTVETTPAMEATR